VAEIITQAGMRPARADQRSGPRKAQSCAAWWTISQCTFQCKVLDEKAQGPLPCCRHARSPPEPQAPERRGSGAPAHPRSRSRTPRTRPSDTRAPSPWHRKRSRHPCQPQLQRPQAHSQNHRREPQRSRSQTRESRTHLLPEIFRRPRPPLRIPPNRHRTPRPRPLSQSNGRMDSPHPRPVRVARAGLPAAFGIAFVFASDLPGNARNSVDATIPA
jgi:hypothetical protein